MVKQFSVACLGLCLALTSCGSDQASHQPSTNADGGDGGEGGTAGVILGNASIKGVVLNISDSPLAGVHVRAGGQDAQTAADGSFQLSQVNAATAPVLEVDATSLSNGLGQHYGKARQALTLGDSDQLTLDIPVHLSPLNPGTDLSASIDADAADAQSATANTDITLFPVGTAGASLKIPSGTKITWPKGATPGTISITPLPLGKLPFAVPGGAGLALQIEPEGITFEGPGADAAPALVLANDLGLDDGTALTLSSVSAKNGELNTVGSGLVSLQDGASVLTVSSAQPNAMQAKGIGSAPSAGLGCSGLCLLQCATRSYVGTVLDQNGAPQVKAAVSLYEGASPALKGLVVAKTVTDDRGRFVFGPQHLCRWQIQADSADSSALAAGNVTADSLPIQVPDLTLTRYSAPANIEVTVLDPAGAPWENVPVVAMPPDDPQHAYAHGYTDENGVARLAGVRTPLQTASGTKQRSSLSVADEVRHCSVPTDLKALPPAPAKPVEPKLDENGLPVWVADQKVTLKTIGASDKPVIKTQTPTVIGSQLIGRSSPFGVALTGTGFSSKAKLVLDSNPQTEDFASLTCANDTLTAHFFAQAPTEVLSHNRLNYRVVNPDKQAATLSFRVTTEPLTGTISRSSFVTLQAPVTVTAAYTPAVDHIVLTGRGGYPCAVGKIGDKTADKQETATFVFDSFLSPDDGILNLIVTPNGCDDVEASLSRISQDFPYSIVNAAPRIDAVTPSVITDTMRKEGFNWKMTGVGINTVATFYTELWLGDRNLSQPAKPYTSTDASLETASSFELDISSFKRATDATGHILLQVPGGVLPDALVTRHGGAQTLGAISLKPGGGIAYSPTLHFTADLLCAAQNGGCDRNAACFDYATSVTCVCKDGFLGDGKHCIDVDECQTLNGGCGAHAICTNTPGSRTCTCDKAYVGDGITCTLKDKCSVDNGGCDSHASCGNVSDTAVECMCNAGYVGNGSMCVVDPCLTANGGFDSHATCTPTTEGALCACNAGYFGSGLTCAVDPCATNNGGCTVSQVCTPTSTGPNCCATGYIADPSGNCVVNKCLTNNGGCGTNFTCGIYSEGMVGCTCKPPYTYDQTFTNCIAP